MEKESPAEGTGDIMTSEKTIMAQTGSSIRILYLVSIEAMLPDIDCMCNGSKTQGAACDKGQSAASNNHHSILLMKNSWTVWYQNRRVERGKWKVEKGKELVDEYKPARIGISSCLLGENVRYDGGHKLDRFLRDTLGKYVDYVPVCPEVECGLGVPRESMHLAGDPEGPRLITSQTGVDLTDRMTLWALNRVKELESENLSGFIFKSRSPACGMERVEIFQENGQAVGRGVGIFARIFMEYFPQIPVEEDGRQHDPDLRENFIEAILPGRRLKIEPSTGSGQGIED